LNRYNLIVSELLNTIKKTEDSLLRLKTKRKTTKLQNDNQLEAKSTTNDEDKIRLQCLLDVEEFGHEVQFFNFFLFF